MSGEDDRLLRAIDLYNRGDYFECLELLEDLHREPGGAEPDLVRALAMLASGMHLHFNRGGGRGALNLMRQCLVLLEDQRPQSMGIATAELFEALSAYVEDLQERRKDGASFFDRWLVPKIRLSD